MNLASRIHGHFHPVDQSAGRTAGSVDDKPSRSAPPTWVRYYDQLTQVVSIGRVDRIHRDTLRIAGFEPGDALLDVGCGTGDLILAAEGMGDGTDVLIGVDIEPAMIDRARQKATRRASAAAFAEGSIDSIGHPDQTFDVVTSSLMFHHLTRVEQADGVAEVLRVLKPGGRFVVVDINAARRSIVSLMPGHSGKGAADVVRAEVSKQLSAAGFAFVSTGVHPIGALSFAVGTKP